MMNSNYQIFTKAIDAKRKVMVSFISQDEIKTRLCIPFDYATSNRYRDGQYRYHFYVLEGTNGPHNLSLLPNRIIKMELTPETFDPKEYVKWIPHWHYQRDWNI